MARCEVKMPESFLQAVSKLADRTDEIVPRILEAGGKVVLAKVRGNLQSSIGRGLKYKGRSTGQLAAALGLSPARLDRNGNHDVKVGFVENRRGKKVSNAMLANILEHGKHGQPPKPFLKPAKTASKSACIAAMTAALENEVRRL